MQDLLSLEERQTLVQYVKSLAERAGAVAELLTMRHEAYAQLGARALQTRKDLESLLAALEKAPARMPAADAGPSELALSERYQSIRP